MMERITQVEESTKNSLDIVIKAEVNIRIIVKKQESLKEGINKELGMNVKEELK